MLSNEIVHSLLEAAPDGLVIVDGSGSIVLVNAQTEKLFGYSREELQGQPVEILIPERSHRKHEGLRLWYSQSPRSRPMGENLTLYGLRKDGQEFPVEISLSPLDTTKGALIISAIRDVTAQRAAEREARDANRVKDEFLATLSHELRTPLTAILGWSTMLGGGMDSATSTRAIQSIGRNARQLAQIVDDVLDVSRIVTGSLRMDVQPVALTTIIEAAIETVRPAAEAKGIQLHVTLDSSPVVAGDPARLQQVVWNLLSNAVKFTPIHGQVYVTLATAPADAHVQIVVRDTGSGIPGDFLPFVFDRFRQADSRSTRTFGGLGLGLSIVRQLVELHGGTVRAESDGENTGATFTVTLPIQAAISDRRRAAPTLQPLSDPARKNGGMPNLRGITVLIVDDDLETRELLAEIVRRTGADAVTAASAARALEILEFKNPDVIVADLAMPREDGYWLIGKIRGRSAADGGGAPAIALTAYARAEDRTRALLAGFQSHMAKPAEPAELLALIASLAGRTGRVAELSQAEQ